MKKIAIIFLCLVINVFPMKKPEDNTKKTEVHINFKNFNAAREKLLKGVGLYISEISKYDSGDNILSWNHSSTLGACAYGYNGYCNNALQDLCNLDDDIELRLKKQSKEHCNSLLSDYFGFKSEQCKEYEQMISSEETTKSIEQYKESFQNLEKSLKSDALKMHEETCRKWNEDFNKYREYENKSLWEKSLFKIKKMFNNK